MVASPTQNMVTRLVELRHACVRHLAKLCTVHCASIKQYRVLISAEPVAWPACCPELQRWDRSITWHQNRKVPKSRYMSPRAYTQDALQGSDGVSKTDVPAFYIYIYIFKKMFPEALYIFPEAFKCPFHKQTDGIRFQNLSGTSSGDDHFYNMFHNIPGDCKAFKRFWNFATLTNSHFQLLGFGLWDIMLVWVS